MSYDLLSELAWRGLIYQKTEGLEGTLTRGPITAYCGFDPTAPSLHVGNLIPVMGLVHLQRAGHRPIVLVGGGTGMIGDPSGKTAERQLNSTDVVAQNSQALRSQLEKFLDFSGGGRGGGPKGALMCNNADWLLGLKAVDFMRDVGKHFSINFMLAKDSVKSRIETGISYTEFSYMLLQAYDFLELNRREGATLQIGGSDQWGNITAGTELLRRSGGGHGKEGHGLTLPLVANTSGTKFGKTESGSVWLDPKLTTPYKFYQFWINVEDADAARYLRYFTLLSKEEVESLEKLIVERPEKREAQQALALDVTTRVHGAQAAGVAEQISGLLFGKSDPRSLSADVLEALQHEIAYEKVAQVPNVIDALVTLKIAQSKGAARRLVEQGGVYVNGDRVGVETDMASLSPLAGGHYLVRKGAREYGVIRAS